MPPTEPERPPMATLPTVLADTERGLFSVVSKALIGKFTPSRRQLLVGNIVVAVSRWRDSFRDCGCWRIDDGYALCDWHERAFRPQREEAERLAAALTVSLPPSDPTAALRTKIEALPRWTAGLKDSLVLRQHVLDAMTEAYAEGYRAALASQADDPSGPDVEIPCGACYHPRHPKGRQCAVPAGDGFPCQCYFPIEAAIRAQGGVDHG